MTSALSGEIPGSHFTRYPAGLWATKDRSEVGRLCNAFTAYNVLYTRNVLHVNRPEF